MPVEFENLISARNGDDDALEAFLSQWRRTLRSMSSNLLGSRVSARADTSDVVQEGMLRTWMSPDNFRGNSPQELEAWGRLVGAGHASKIRRQQLAQGLGD